MAINVKFDLAGNPETPTIILAKRNGDKLGQLYVNADSVDLSDKLNGSSEMTFTLNKYIDDKITLLWSEVTDFKLIWCKEWDVWFEIKVELDEATETVKTVFCTQLGQAELSQLMLYNIEINTENDIARDDYDAKYPTVLYRQNNHTEASLLHRLLKDKAPHYSIAHVDSTIANIQRTFSFDGTSICDAFNEIAEEIGCLFVYNSNSTSDGKPNRTISVYDLQQNCNGCGHRGEFTEKCPKCGSADIKYGYGDDTLIFVTADELASNNITLTTDTDSVKNCFKLEAGDDLMTATIRNCNPNGSDYIWYFSEAVKKDMSKELRDKIDSYDVSYKQNYDGYVSDVDTSYISKYNEIIDKYSKYNSDLKKITTPIKGYSSLMNAYYNVVDLAYYLKSSLMPSVEMSKTNATEQAKLLTSAALSPVAVKNINSVSLATADSAVLAIAKIIVKSTFKVKVNASELNEDTKTWKGNFIITNYSDDEDEAISNTIPVTISGDEESFIKQKIDKALNKDNTDDLSISGLFEEELSSFKEELKKYALNPLISFRDASQSCIDILIEQGVGKDKDIELYNNLYRPYLDKLDAVESEIKVRENEINLLNGVYNTDGELTKDGLITKLEKCKNQIQKTLNFQEYLGTDLWLEFASFRREDKYSNSNYTSEGLEDNGELFKKALEFIEVAENEIYKSAELQHSISTTLKNLLAIDKFKSLVDSFEVGNWLRIQINDEVYKLRLLEYEISFGDFNDISVEFSDVMKIKNGISDISSVLSQASSMASSYDSVQRQASQGSNANNTVDKWLADGLNSALVQIQNNNSEEVTLTRNGLLGRSYDEITDTYSPKQVRLTHNIMAFTDDNWKTVRTALGEHNYKYYNGNKPKDATGYGLSADFVTAGYISGSQIIGGEIYSSNYEPNSKGTYFDLMDGYFQLAGGSIVYKPSDNPNEDSKLELKNVKIEWTQENKPSVEVSEVEGLQNYLDEITDIETQLDSRAETWYQNTDPSTAWNTNDVKKNHVGDLWHYTGETGSVNGVNRIKNSEWVWKNENGVYKWVPIEISDDVFDAIDGKAQIFTSTPTPPYYVGDLWVQGSTGDIKHCINNRESGSYSAGDWVKSSKYTDDTKANEAYTLADQSKGIAENARDLGNKLKTALGFTTEITDDYVISPVIGGGTLLIGNTTGTYAQITTSGKLIATGADISGVIKATDGEFTGKITANSGSIGNWTISPTRLYVAKTNSYNGVGMNASSHPESCTFWAGYSGNGTNPWDDTSGDYRTSTSFYVLNNGFLKASNAEISGKITAREGGSIAGFNIGSTAIYNGTNSLTSNTDGVYVGTNGIRTVGDNGSASHYSYCSKYQSKNDSNYLLLNHSGIGIHSSTSSMASVDFYEGNTIVGLMSSSGIITYNTASMGDNTCLLDWNGDGNFNVVTIKNGLEVKEYGLQLNGVNRCIYSKNSNLSIFISANGDVVNNIGDTTEYEHAVRFGTDNTVAPCRTNKISLGRSDLKWSNIYATTSSIGTSDRTMKDNIKSLTDIHEQFLMKLIPVSFTFKDGTSGRTHIGFISQDVEDAMNEIGMTSLDFAGFCKDVKVKPSSVPDEVEPDLDENGNEQYIYSLRYGEFVALNTYMIQKLSQRISDLENKLGMK